MNRRIKLLTIAMAGLLLVTAIIVTVVRSHAVRLFPVTIDGWGPVRIGMTVTEASEALGTPLTADSEPDPDDQACYYVYAKALQPSPGFMVTEGHIARVDVSERGIRTGEGIGVGSSEAAAVRRYKGMARVEPHFYTGPEGHYVIVEPRPGFQIVFETDGKRVLMYRAGKLPEVGYVEGCF